MATFCLPEETARVTLPDGSIQNFTDTPITIEIEEDIKECQRIAVSIAWTRTGASNTSGTTTVNYWGVYEGFYITSNNKGIRTFTQGYAQNNCSDTILDLNHFSIPPLSARVFTSATLVSIVPLNPDDDFYKLTITNSEGSVLFTDTYDNPNYDVECLDSCPDDTIDCGDCCLPCDDVLDQLCLILAKFG